ncbi:MAG TPA: LuxR C-terminal-related transcriptional regulator [Candidatus Baltobacteraceae bacterium]
MFERKSDSNEIDEDCLTIVKRRAKPHVLLLNEDLSIAFAEADATAVLAHLLDFPKDEILRLPAILEDAVRRSVNSWRDEEPSAKSLVVGAAHIILRISRLAGAAGSFIAVFIEQHSRREDLADAALRYHLSRRELEVLALILAGLTAEEIAARLFLAETTVCDYFKHLIKKTGARNRAEMLGRALGWDESESLSKSAPSRYVLQREPRSTRR